jgi:hypothetical protein
MIAGKFAIVAAFAAGICGAAFAQGTQPNDTPQQNPENATPQNPQPQDSAEDPAIAVIGSWEFSNADRDKVCHITFRAEAVTGGRRLDIDKNCPNFFPSTKNIAAWAVDNYGDLRLVDAQGVAVIELSQVEGGMYDGFSPQEGRYILQTAAAAPVRTANDMVGDWSIAHSPGKPICTLTLANSPVGAGAAADVLSLKVKPGCDAAVMRFNPTGWRMQEGDLMLLSARGQSWQFEENDANTWQRVPESSDPILLTRQ